jgi:3-methyladenine DNA glycosylase AlkD
MARTAAPTPRDVAADVASALAWLKKRGTKANRDGMARYAIVAPQVFGVSVGDLRRLAGTLGVRHDLAEPLWKTGWYEARMLVGFIADPARVTPAQMERWTRDFDNWAICDHLTFHLFDRTAHAWSKVDQWAAKDAEFVKRASFALFAALALHDKDTGDGAFLDRLPLVEAAATDPRNFVKKGVSWALRSIGSRNVVLHTAALALSERLAASKDAPSRWVGKDALRDLSRPLIAARVRKKSAAAAARAAKRAR